MKWLKVFSIFVVLNLLFWVGAHLYKQANPQAILVVADTSFSLKPQYSAMQSWIDDYSANSRYREITVGTDKALIGALSEIKSTDSIFRVSFGRSTPESLMRYESEKTDQRIFLSDGSFTPPGWTLVTFP